MDKLGIKIRRQRQNKDMTLKMLAEETGLSVSFLSEIERGVSKPSMSSLRSIAQVLGLSLLSFADEDAADDSTNSNLISIDKHYGNYISDVKVVRANQRKRLGYPDRPGYYELLTPDLNRMLEVLYVKIEPGFETGPEPIIDPPGEKFIFVMKGIFQVIINDEETILNAGDSIYYPANASVHFKTIGSEPVELILTVTPPGF